MENSSKKAKAIIQSLGIKPKNNGTYSGSKKISKHKQYHPVYSPVNDSLIASITFTEKKDFDTVLQHAQEAFEIWKNIPAPQRGELVRQIGDEFRKHKSELAYLVSYEMGKSYQEGLGEVQEMIDIADFAVGLSRQLYGLTMHSERPQHRMYEQYHSLGIVGIISAFNFPVAVWSWNAFIAWVCGDVCIWKPSEKTPLSALACQLIASKIIENNNYPSGLSCLINGGAEVGNWLSECSKIPLISATGSSKMGKIVAQKVAGRFGKSLLELGGNNALTLTPSANLNLAIQAAVFGAVGTCGQRCTTTRRLLVQEVIYPEVKKLLKNAYKQLKIGNPLDAHNHLGPLIDEDAVNTYLDCIQAIEKEGGKIITKSGLIKNSPGKCYVYPVIAEVKSDYNIVQTETFAPILYLIPYVSLDEAIEIQNNVPQGLSSSIMTNNLKEMELFLSVNGSDCGIANVNIGTSGAEIGGAFGGEKETGGGRESGSDAWKIYMRRQTNTINYGEQLPLAQGIQFKLK